MNNKNFLDEITDLVSLARREKSQVIAIQAAELMDIAEQYLKGDISEKDLNRLLESQKRLIKQYLNTLEIEARASAEKILFRLLNVITSKILSTE